MSKYELVKIASKILETCMEVKAGEEFLVVIDEQGSEEIADAAMVAAHLIGALPHKIVTTTRPSKEEPSRTLATAMKSVDAGWILVPIHYTWAHEEALKAGARFLDIPGITTDILLKLWDLDFEEAKNVSETITNIFNEGKTVRITSQAGTDLTVPVKTAFACHGFVTKPGDVGYAPLLTTLMSPSGHAEGKVVYDGSLRPVGMIREPISMDVEKGVVTHIEGGKQVGKFKEYIKSFNDTNAYKIPAHVCVGLHPKAELTGSALEDERVLGLINIAIGDNIHLPGGEIESTAHIDGTLLKGSLTVDNTIIVEDGIVKI